MTKRDKYDLQRVDGIWHFIPKKRVKGVHYWRKEAKKYKIAVIGFAILCIIESFFIR